MSSRTFAQVVAQLAGAAPPPGCGASTPQRGSAADDPTSGLAICALIISRGRMSTSEIRQATGLSAKQVWSRCEYYVAQGRLRRGDKLWVATEPAATPTGQPPAHATVGWRRPGTTQ